MGVGSGFEGAVPRQVAEYPSSSMQATGQSTMRKADTNNNDCAVLHFSGPPLGSCSVSSEVRKDTVNGLSSLLGTIRTGFGSEALLPLALVASDSVPEPSQS